MRKVLIVVGLLLCTSVASAQELVPATDTPTISAPSFAFAEAPLPGEAMQVPPVINPSGVSFSSADHNVTDLGVPVISRYTMDIMAASAPGGTPVKAGVDLGKPTLTSGTVTWTQFATVRATMTAGDYVAKIWAEGPGGRSGSPLSDPFTLAPRLPSAPGKPVVNP